MRIRLHAALVGLAVVAIGCVLSVDSVIPESFSTLDARLVGTWQPESDNDRAVVSRASGNSYEIRYTSDGKTGTFVARLGQLGNRMVLDVRPAPDDSELPEPYKEMLIRGHLLLAVEIGANTVSTAMLDSDTLRTALQARQVPLDYVRAENQVVLTDSSAQLRAALGSYLQRPGALQKPGVWRRVQP